MILVAGLALVGLVGIAAAFYFSMRPGSPRDEALPGSPRDEAVPGRSGDSRGPGGSGAPRGARPGRAAASRPPASRSRTSPPSSGGPARPASPAPSARPGRSARGAPVSDGTGPSTVIDFTDPRMGLEDSGPLVTGHRARHGGRQDDAPDVAAAQRMAARGSHQADPDNTDMTARSRRRVAWRKGTGVDEELWPAEEFGGVSDEQFWNDLAADRPLATTARTAQPDTAARRLPPDAGRRPDPQPGTGRIPDPQPGDPARQAAGRVAGDGAGTHPQPRLGPDDRTAVQPAVAAMPPSPGPARPVRAAYQAAPVPSPAATGAQEDPLTSPAYALRPKGAVDGRSPQSSRHSMDANGGDTGRRPGASWAGPLPSDRIPAGSFGVRRHGREPGLPAGTGGRLPWQHGLPVPAAAFRGAASFEHPAVRPEVRIPGPGRAGRPGRRPRGCERRLAPRPGGRPPRRGPGSSGLPARQRLPRALRAGGLRPLVTSLGRPHVHRGRQAGGRADARLRRDPAAGFLHNVSSGIRHALCPREMWCGTPPAACTRRWRDGP